MTADTIRALLGRLLAHADGLPGHALRGSEEALQHCHDEGLAQRDGDGRWAILGKGRKRMGWVAR